MNGYPRWLAIPAAVALTTACGGEAGGSPADSTPSADTADYVLLTDDDANPDQVRGEPGTYALAARGAATPPLAVLDVPAGYANFGAFALVPEGFPDVDVLSSVQYWTVDGVFVDPCAMDDRAPDAGTSVQELVTALAAQERSTATEPVPVALDGHEGQYLELTAPDDVDFSTCDAGYFGYWEGKPDDAQHTVDSPGTVDHLWVMDVDGDRVVLVVATPPGTTAADAGELTAIVESVRFVEPD